MRKTIFLNGKTCIILTLPFMAFLLFLTFWPIKNDSVKVIIRFDDYGVWCNDDWLQIEEEVIKLHEKYNVKLTYAVIPESKYPLIKHPYSPTTYPSQVVNKEINMYPLVEGSRRVDILKESTSRGITEVALHGFYHPKGYSNISKNTEFYNVPYDIQFQKIHDGKKILDSLFCTNVTTFIPPHNTYDNLTLDLLYEHGFKCVSAKQNNFDAPEDKKLGINMLWFTSSEIPIFFNNIKGSHYSGEPIQVLALHHTNFTTDGVIDKNKMAVYEELLKYISDNNIPNYLFSEYSNKDNMYNETYYKSAYQNLKRNFGSTIAAKFANLFRIFDPVYVMIIIQLSLLLFSFSILNFVFNTYQFKKQLIHLLNTANVLVALLIVALIYNAAKISLYSVLYIMYSQKMMLLTFVFTIIFSFCIKANLSKENDECYK